MREVGNVDDESAESHLGRDGMMIDLRWLGWGFRTNLPLPGLRPTKGRIARHGLVDATSATGMWDATGCAAQGTQTCVARLGGTLEVVLEGVGFGLN